MGPQRFHQRHVSIGRGDKIRTCDPLHPMQVRYQAAPRPDRTVMIAEKALENSPGTLSPALLPSGEES
jgi:hypothetical protein